ncbi:MAG: hypothetical protein KKB50_20440 [Planctomycetes bacterium]|nr:hypothetical protein [Planctomycetota bacterium]
MCTRMFVQHLILVAFLAGACLPASTQVAEEREPNRFSHMINIEALIDNYARLLARKYDLTEEQDAFTQELLHKKTQAFLENREDELRGLIDRLFDVRTGGDITQEEIIEWGKRVLPIYQEARVFIIDGNQEWRQILNEEQRLIHDEDIKLMHESFQTTDEQLERIVTGQMTIEEFRNPPRRAPRRPQRAERTVTPEPTSIEPPAAAAGEPQLPDQTPPLPAEPRPDSRRRPPVVEMGESKAAEPGSSRSTERHPKTSPRPTPRSADKASSRQPTAPRGSSTPAGTGFESKWDAYVADFIKKYQLNEEQTPKAQAILKGCKEQGQHYMRAHQAEIDKLDEQNEKLKLSKAKDKSKQMADLTERRKKLMEPIELIFEKQLKPRLDKLPTRAQRRAAEAAKKSGPGKPTPRKTRGDDGDDDE